ncbi:MAG TPA: DUF445 domain-containing protein [Stellaceae bacterium]|jgi:uncharacterized membrane-anchored protein YjiN (DUF445 family)|nr:DUF445 domain-containing protein [Stellaceae bacterium]
MRSFITAKSDLTEKRRSLRRHRAFATGLLLLAVAIFMAAREWPGAPFAARLLGAAAEAAMVGGLADWFAITALFRHPLGLPIPHTALIPAKKSDIGKSLGGFVRDNFLDPELLLERLRRENRARQLAGWLTGSRNADFIAERIVAAAPTVIETLDDQQVRIFLGKIARERLHHINFMGAVDAVLKHLVDSGKHLVLLDALLEQIKPALQRNRDTIAAKVGDFTGRWVPEFVDRRLAIRAIEAIEKSIDAVSTPGDPERLRLDRWMKDELTQLRTKPGYANAIEDLKQALSDQPALLGALETLWGEIKAEILADLNSASPKGRLIATELVQTTGRLLENSPAMQKHLNAAIETVLIDYITPWRLGIGNFIADRVASWDGRQVADIIELQVGKDLQYVRVNGTVVGALIGVVLFLLNELLPHLWR